MKNKKRLTILIVSAYIVLTAVLAGSVVNFYFLLSEEESVFKDAEPWIKIIVGGFPQFTWFIVISVLAAIALRKVNSDNNGQSMVMQQTRGEKR